MTSHALEGTITSGSGLLAADLNAKFALNGTISAAATTNATLLEGTIQAVSEISGTLTQYPILNVRDSDNVLVDKVDFESVKPGIRSGTQILTFTNNGVNPLNITLTPKAAINPLGVAIDTYQSTYLSLDGDTYHNILTLQIPALDSLDCYLYYQPPSTAKIGEKVWEISQRSTELNGVNLLSGWFYAKPYTITGSTVDQVNARVGIKIDYVAGVMRGDFGDLRFTGENGILLDYEMVYKVDNTVAFFIVTVPGLPQSPATTKIYAYAGNATETSTAQASTTLLSNWTDGTLAPWINESWKYGGAPTCDVVNHPTFNENVLHQNADWANWAASCSLSSTAAYGFWELYYKWNTPATANMNFVFMLNDSNNYNIRLTHPENSATATLALLRSGTSIGSTTVNFDTNPHKITVLRESNGIITVYMDHVQVLTVTDTTITTSQKTRITTSIDWYNPCDGCEFYFDYVKINNAHQTGPITRGDWNFYLILNANGGILYKSQDLPELTPEVRFGCRVGGVYFE